MDHHQAGSGAKFNGEITIGNRVQGVFCRFVESQQFCCVVAINGVGGARQSSGAQGGLVEPLATIQHAAIVPLQHFVPGQQVVAEGDRLGGLQVGKAGHYRAGLSLRQLYQARLQSGNFAADKFDLPAQIQTDIGGDLVVARATRMQLFAGDADFFGQARLDIHMHVFKSHRPGEATVLDFFANFA